MQKSFVYVAWVAKAALPDKSAVRKDVDDGQDSKEVYVRLVAVVGPPQKGSGMLVARGR